MKSGTITEAVAMSFLELSLMMIILSPIYSIYLVERVERVERARSPSRLAFGVSFGVHQNWLK